MASLQISKKKIAKPAGEVVVIDIGGSLDAHTAPQLDEAVTELINAKNFKVIVNFAKLEYISSAGMGLFIGWIDNFRSNSGDIIMVSLKQNVFKVFKILGFDKIFSIFETEDEALAKF